ncbi:unnamed protein product [Bursaphelenchus xylophilus]|uniref:(pine wood nematode) hypothetical protein n=1 Tax=Bursaphelenchus xylophilus TaxID=6326 RepID=A0A1I7SHA7_BURXY|nr:unnamed protein product [Bursaphelenchus xylophilus]CAG9100445.1 unnamed protein product [Bursaphelenchus xylophilus]
MRTVDCGGPDAEFDKDFALSRLNRCVKSPDLPECSNVTKPEILLQKLYWHINHPRKNGIKYFEDCSQIVYKTLPRKYTKLLDQYNTLGFGRNKKRCISIDALCGDLTQYLRPFVCFMMRNCERRMSEMTYALAYGFQQLTLEQEGPIRCSSNPSDSQFDLKPEVYKIGRSIEGVRLVKDEICNGVGEVEVLTETDPEHVFSAALYKRVLAYKGDSE